MPVIIALFLRKLVMAAATGGITTIIQKSIDGGFKSLVYEIRDTEGVTEEDAWDIVRNITSDFLINTAGSLLALQTKLPVKTAELLGLTSKGIVKKTLKGKAAQVATKIAADGGKKLVKGSMPNWIKIAGIPASAIWLVSAIANIVEPGIYKPEQTNAVYKALGIPFQYPSQSASDKPGPFSSDSSVTFADYYKSLEASGVKGINNTFALQTQLFNKQNLSDLVNAVYGKAVTDGKALSVKQLIEAVAPYLIGGNGGNINISNINSTNNNGGNNNNSSAVAPANAKQNAGSTTQQIKVFTGVVSQGALGQGLSFQERQDDLIENMDELKQASSNNLAPFLAALPSRVRYEIKVVSSITTKDGFTQKGNAQQVKIGTYADGKPKYKTVVNKFAVMDLYIFTDRNTKTKITTIVLGPTNALTFQPGINELNTLAEDLPKLVTTQDMNEISSITTTKDVIVNDTLIKEVYKIQELTGEYIAPPGITNSNIENAQSAVNSLKFAWVNDPQLNEWRNQIANATAGANTLTNLKDKENEFLKDWNAWNNRLRQMVDHYFENTPGAVRPKGYSVTDTNNIVTSVSSNGNVPNSNALTLSEWYQSQGQALPPVSERASEYERLGLGPRSYYIGTAEQNTKLLNALKYK